eukprot:gnl/TRDRNA2_/TRDRNA2_83462_c0_seq1.p1 gnl/TRDRNA2_/TRDRNA2_83462_c0~~gnl/TRDRNA2_/TRDRNA2_83462_c0_seq1.p1  ORF type:complete len:384 (+),score=81.44 gnl/TRDRNA2_/TRDRNA2_83462_c0_seq1:93-1244(+)
MRRCMLCQCLTRDDYAPQLPGGVVGGPFNKDNEDRGWETPEDPGALLAAAVHMPGRLATAARYLEHMEELGLDPLDYIDQTKLQKVKRFRDRFEAMIKLSRPDTTQPGWRTGENREIGMSFAYSMEEDYMSVLCLKDFKGVDAVNGVVGYLEADLRCKHVKGIQEVNVIKSTEDAALWSQLTEVDDHVMQIEVVNALDESLGTIVHMLYSAGSDNNENFPEVPIPPARREVRPKNYLQVIEFEPLQPGDHFRVHYAFKMLMPPTMKTFVTRSPPFIMDRMLRSAFSLWPTDFEKFHVAWRDDVRQRETNSVHAPFYSLCRATLEQIMCSKDGWKLPNAMPANSESDDFGEPEPEDGGSRRHHRKESPDSSDDEVGMFSWIFGD